MLEVVDVYILCSVVLYSGIVLLTYDNYSQAVQNWLVLVTHVFAIPMIYILRNTAWIFSTVIIGLGCSVAYHTSIVFDVGQEYTGPLDISFSTLTLILVTVLVLFEEFPEWMLPVLLFAVLLLGVFWNDQMVADIIGGVTILCQLIFVIKRTLDYFFRKADSKRDILFLYISLTLGGGGVVAFLTDGKHSDEHYAIIHSIWHTCAYVAMYFGLRSIRRSDITDMRVPRVVFNNRITLGKIAYH
jgi:hypothetical protein